MATLIQELESTLSIKTPSDIQPVDLSWLPTELPDVYVKRDDLIHPIISGNKWRKLKYALVDIMMENTSNIVSFGGGFSNHLHALGYCCHKLNLNMTAIVRGDYSKNLTPMLHDLMKWGVDIQFVNRETYRQRNEKNYLKELRRQHQATVIPEGGSQTQALQGVAEIISENAQDFSHIFCPVGSGGTLAGLIKGTGQSSTHVIGIGVLKGQDYLEKQVAELYPQAQYQRHWHIEHDYHFGGYGKRPDKLMDFCQTFTQETGLDVEPVYSGKLAFALCDLLQKGRFPLQSSVLMLHTGGLQGQRSSLS